MFPSRFLRTRKWTAGRVRPAVSVSSPPSRAYFFASSTSSSTGAAVARCSGV